MKTTVMVVLAALAMLVAKGEEDGGFMTIWPKNAGLFLFVNAQDKVPERELEAPVLAIAQETGFDIRLTKGTMPDLRAVPGELKRLEAKGAIWVVCDPALPIVLAACEDGWGVLNVARLAETSDTAKRYLRVSDMSYRLFGYLHGTSDPLTMPACVMKPAVGMEGLDRLLCHTYSPETTAKICTSLRARGYAAAWRGSYFDACEEGWAPAPTNAVQKAIWDKVHQMPKNPIPIKPETKKVER